MNKVEIGQVWQVHGYLEKTEFGKFKVFDIEDYPKSSGTVYSIILENNGYFYHGNKYLKCGEEYHFDLESFEQDRFTFLYKEKKRCQFCY